MGHKVKQSSVNSRIDFFYYAFRNVLLVSIPLLIVSGVVLSHLSLHSAATGSSSGSTSSTDSLSFSISSSCTLSSVVDESHNAELINGTYVSGIGQTTITTLCNDGNGYSVYATGYSNNEEGNNKLVNTESSNFSIISGTATSGTTSNWAMSLNHLVDDPSLTPPTITLDYDGIYGIVPNEWTKVASLPARATDMIKGSSFTTTYAVYTSSSQYAGTYQGQVKYLLTHPYSTDEHIYYMQEVDAWKNTLALEQSLQAIDKRDGKKYWVTKLKDGNIWMTQNLDFDIEANTVLDSNTTDLNVAYDSSTGQYAEYSDGYTESNGIIYYTPASTATTIDFTGTTVTGWKNSDTVPYSANKTDDTEIGHASLGNYYNWTVAIASNNASSLASGNAANSICPAGWRLPNIYMNEFGTLLVNYGVISNITGPAYTEDGFNIIRSSPLYFIQAGLIGTSSSDGSYISSTSNSTSKAGNLYLQRTTNVYPNGSDPRSNGVSVRCIAK